MDASLHRNRINLHCTAWWMFSWDIYVCIALSYLPNNWAGWSRIHRTHFMKKHFAGRNRGKMPCSRRGVKFFDFPKTILALIDPSKFFLAQFYREIIDLIWYRIRVFSTDRKFIGKLWNRRISSDKWNEVLFLVSLTDDNSKSFVSFRFQFKTFERKDFTR